MMALIEKVEDLRQKISILEKKQVPIVEYRGHLIDLTRVIAWLVDNVAKNGADPPPSHSGVTEMISAYTDSSYALLEKIMQAPDSSY